MRDWEPGKNSFYRSQYGWSNHSSNGRILRNGNQEEIEYQRQHGGTISDLFTGGKDNMLLQLLHLAHHIMVHLLQIKLARKLVKETINRIGRLSGGKDVNIDLGFLNGLKQQPNESYIDYANVYPKVRFGILKIKLLMI